MRKTASGLPEKQKKKKKRKTKNQIKVKNERKHTAGLCLRSAAASPPDAFQFFRIIWKLFFFFFAHISL